ncbi:MAG: radical SAM protein [Phycisphaerales bacterium]|jgi:radical SAM superfamily enzyme YgiQ (UPF0313 family)|nr:radical SAM protein [Phycisphaerales bacterium]
MKILLINPPMTSGRSHDAMEPLAFAILAGLTGDEHQIEFIDNRIEPLPSPEAVDIVAISVQTFTARRAYEIAGVYRTLGAKVVMGGFHATLCSDEVQQHADAVVVGPAETIWAQLLDDAKQGRLKHRYIGSGGMEQIQVDRSIFAGKRYKPISLVETARGCRFACDFCSIHAFHGDHVELRPIQNVTQELKSLKRRRVCFTDDNMLTSPERLGEMLDQLEKLNIKWMCQASVDLSADTDLLARMARSGCRVVTVGFESLNPASLKQMHKPWNRNYGDYIEAVNRFRAHGIMVYGTFACGYDSETPQDVQNCLDFAMDARLMLANFNPLTPMPGTALYERLRSQGRLLNEAWWLDPNYRYGQVVFQPGAMSPQDLEQACWDARKQFNNYRNILRRAWDAKANFASLSNAAVFMLANIVNRREIYRKQGSRLGSTHETAAN